MPQAKALLRAVPRNAGPEAWVRAHPQAAMVAAFVAGAAAARSIPLQRRLYAALRLYLPTPIR